VEHFKKIKTIIFFIMLIVFGGVGNISSCFAQGIQRAQDHIKKAKKQPASVGKDSVLAYNYNYLAEAYSYSDS
jgi:hypothetical protein